MRRDPTIIDINIWERVGLQLVVLRGCTWLCAQGLQLALSEGRKKGIGDQTRVVFMPITSPMHYLFGPDVRILPTLHVMVCDKQTGIKMT